MNVNNIDFPERKIKRFGVFFACCIDYDADIAQKSLPGVAPEAEKFIEGMKEAYDVLTFCTYDAKVPDSGHLTHKRLRKELKEVRESFATNAENLDALMIIYAGHGIQDTMVLSDGKKFLNTRFENAFGKDVLPEFADKPIIFMYSKCRGSQVSRMKIEDKYYHRDENTIRVYANSPGDQIADNKDKGGGFMMTSLNDWLKNVAPVTELSFQDWMQATTASVIELSKHKEVPEILDKTSYKVTFLPKKKIR